MQPGIQEIVASKIAFALQQTTYIEGVIISDATSLAIDLRLGRLGRIKLALYLEDIFELEIPNEVVDTFEVVGDIVRYCSGRYFQDHGFAVSAELTCHALA